MSRVARTTYVLFESTMFNNTVDREYFVNPDCYGDDVCAFVANKFVDSGIACSKPVGEDWGWLLVLDYEKQQYDLCTNYHVDGFWLIWIQKTTNGISEAFFGSAKDNDVPLNLVRILHDILAAAAEIREIRWCSEDEFNVGLYSGLERPA